jgi:hypothetical protein
LLVLDDPQVLRLGVWCEDVEDDIPATVKCEFCIVEVENKAKAVGVVPNTSDLNYAYVTNVTWLGRFRKRSAVNLCSP